MIEIGFLILAFFAGVLTIIAPCVIPLLPVILGSSATNKSWKRPMLIILSLSVSVFLFTVFLHLTANLFIIPTFVWEIFSGAVVIFYGFILLFPQLWDKLMYKTGFSSKSDQLLHKSTEKKGVYGDILVGASLGLVLNSCSPTYLLIAGTILPQSFGVAIVYLISYIVGLTAIFTLVAIFGASLTKRMKFLYNPHGKFRRGLGIFLIITGILIATGLLKAFSEVLIESPFYQSYEEFESNLTREFL